MDFIVKIFKALASDHRVRILSLLISSGELSIEAIAGNLKLPYKTAARNLKILEHANLTVSRRRNGFTYYSLRRDQALEYNSMIFTLFEKRNKKKK